MSTGPVPEFIDVPARLKRYLFPRKYLFRGQVRQHSRASHYFSVE
jgi:hypothetical protein